MSYHVRISNGAHGDETLPDTGEVFAIYVLREYHGTGVGRALMQAVLIPLGII